MALKPLNVSRDIESVPPAIAASRRPSRTASAALPIAIVLDAQAVTMHERRPFEAEVRRDDVDRGVRKVVPDIGRGAMRDAPRTSVSR